MTDLDRDALRQATAGELSSVLPSKLLQEYRFGKWAQIVNTVTPDEVITPLSLSEVTTAKNNGSIILVEIVDKYSLNVIADKAVGDDLYTNEDTSYLIAEEPGKRGLLLRLQESTAVIQLHVDSVEVSTSDDETVDNLNWVVTGHSDYCVVTNKTTISNYSNHYQIHCKNGSLTWLSTEMESK